VLAFATGENSYVLGKDIVSTFDVNSLPIDQGICHHFSCVLDDPPECGSGNAHLLPGFLIGHAQKIGKAYGFTLINGEENLLKFHQGNASGFEITNIRVKSDNTVFFGSYHDTSSYEIILRK